MNNFEQYDGVIVLGRGNYTDNGFSSSTHNNALSAAGVAEETGAKLIIASGYGPNSSERYAQTEASYMANIINIHNPDVTVVKEEESTSTFENFINVRHIFKEQEFAANGLLKWLIVANTQHAKRGLIVAKKILPQELQLFSRGTDEKLSSKEIAMETTLSYLSWLATRGIKPDNHDSVVKAHNRYKLLIAPFKQNSSAKAVHSGR
jgi:uncharacterized SAM-binding protein YcdF (DUF218 family)